MKSYLKLTTVIAVALVCTQAGAEQFSIPAGDLKVALDSYAAQTGSSLIYVSSALRGARTQGVNADLPADQALSRILSGSGFIMRRDPSGAIGIDRARLNAVEDVSDIRMAQTAPAPRAAVETVTVTSSKLGGADVQSIPIAITALSQEQLTATQTAGGPDLVKQVPNLTFSKTNFSGYNIQIRGIGTQAISVTTDPAVAVALNDIPFIRNHFFEQEFFDLSQAEVLRGPQGTLYGRNATAGVVNLVTAKPTDQFEAQASADIGNYHNRRFEGMINIPIVDDRLDIRLAGEWTKRNGYTLNALTGNQVDGRDLWSGRLSVAWKPLENLKANLVWEHFSEDDDRMRTAKQLCKTDPGRQSVNGVPLLSPTSILGAIGLAFTVTQASVSQGCLPASLYSPESFEVPNGYALPYVVAGYITNAMNVQVDPYASTTQSRDLRVIETQIDPIYKAKSDTAELNLDYSLTPALTFTSQTGYNQDFLWSTEDYNRFNTSPGIFTQIPDNFGVKDNSLVSPAGYFCDPQLGCSDRLVAQDLSSEHAWQLSQEFRLSSNFAGPLNFSLGGNYMHYETVENYYVFANTLSLLSAYGATIRTVPYVPGVTDNLDCLLIQNQFGNSGRQYNDPRAGAGLPTEVCHYMDPNSLQNVNDLGHNYFLSKNPYALNSYAGFGEVYYNIFKDLKLTGGLRWTDDRKHFTLIPSELLAVGYGYADIGTVNQQWSKFTGRAAVNWTPQLDFTDQTLIYGSYARGYKAGGANPPGPVLTDYNGTAGGYGVPIHPLTFAPEYVNAFELGSKNTLLDGAITLNGDIFFYDYKGYQISEIVDRTSINLNFDATVNGAELEASYEPLPGLRFKFAGGYEHTRLANGSSSVDLIDRTAGRPGWVVMKPFVTESSNCILPEYVVAVLAPRSGGEGASAVSACGVAYNSHLDPVTFLDYDVETGNGTHLPVGCNCGQGGGIAPPGYPGFDPLSVDPNAPANVNNGLGLPGSNGAGFAKDLSGNELPNAPKFTTSFSAEYSMPITEEWAATLHGDFYWQAAQWARVFNDDPYDRIHGYTNVNLALVLTSQSGWQVMGYLKNVFDTTAITGTFLNSDDSGLTTNIFLTDPRLFGVRVTKNW